MDDKRLCDVAIVVVVAPAAVGRRSLVDLLDALGAALHGGVAAEAGEENAGKREAAPSGAEVIRGAGVGFIQAAFRKVALVQILAAVVHDGLDEPHARQGVDHGLGGQVAGIAAQPFVGEFPGCPAGPAPAPAATLADDGVVGVGGGGGADGGGGERGRF